MPFEQSKKIDILIGPPISLTELTQIGERALPRYLEDSLTSPVPIILPLAIDLVAANINSEIATPQYSGLEYPQMELTLRLFKNPFSNPVEAQYAITYAAAISSAKYLRETNTTERQRIRSVNGAFAAHAQEHLATYTQRFGMKTEDLVKYVDLLPISPMEAAEIRLAVIETAYFQEILNNITSEVGNLKQTVISLVGIPAVAESRVETPPSATTVDKALHWLYQRFTHGVSANDLAQIRQYINNYFQSDRNVSLIKLLAMANGKR